MELTSSKEGKSFSTISRNNTEILAAMKAQGNLEQRIEEFVVHSKVAPVAVAELYIPGRLGPKESTDLVTTLSLTLEQTRGLRQFGVNLASEKAMSQEESQRELPMVHRQARLQVKPRDKEPHETIQVTQSPRALPQPF